MPLLGAGARVWGYTPPSEDQPGHPERWREITVGQPFGTGGTAEIYEMPELRVTQTLIKIFHLDFTLSTKQAFFDKLWLITQRRLKLDYRVPCVAWPQSIIFSRQTAVAEAMLGCTLTLFDNAMLLHDIADLESLNDHIPGATMETLRTIALNIITSWELMQSRMILFGDPNARNILVNRSTLEVKFIDADSYGLTLVPPGGHREVFYAPPASTNGYRSPRSIANNDKPLLDYNIHDDNYVLAIHLFKLLVPGFHPWHFNEADPRPAEMAAVGRRFEYSGANSLPHDCIQMKYFRALPGDIQSAFIATFGTSRNPVPPSEWRRLFQSNWRSLRGQAHADKYPQPKRARTAAVVARP